MLDMRKHLTLFFTLERYYGIYPVLDDQPGKIERTCVIQKPLNTC